jgi:hypothetical protein
MKTNKATRKIVRERAKGFCEYCLSPVEFSPGPFAAEHTIPTARGGDDALENLAFSCQGCNGHKFTAVDALDPVTKLIAPLFNPRQERWNEHFEWSADFLFIIGTSPTGRATVERLQFNRPNLVNLRRALLAIDMHPAMVL